MTEADCALDAHVSTLEREWRRAFEAHVQARTTFYALAASPSAPLDEVDRARELYEQTEAGKNHVLDKVDRLERTLGEG